ncbi:peptide chain release factor aRF-1 [Candidatus Woesearchaeota archaeon]|nr:peptide chain release factor aRF-1 [Candidatus Woesearchaeota archaeon]
MAADETQRYKLKKFLKKLEGVKGRHTELVSVYIPAGYDINKVMTQILDEQGTATNIKSTSTRKNVLSALERMIQHLKIIGRTPPNGIAIFSGNISEVEGKADYQVFSIEPPSPITQRIYRCDKTFVLEPLMDQLEVKECYGLVTMDKREATLALLKGKSIQILSSATSNVPGKTRAGGQSAMRFSRLRDIAANEFFKKVGDMMKKEYFQKENLKGIIIGGPGRTKQDFIDSNAMIDGIKKKIIAIRDLTYTDEFGIQELLEKSQDILAEEAIAGEKEIVMKFLNMLATQIEKVAYGLAEVKRALEMGAVETLLVSEALDESITEELEKIAKQFNTNVQIISTETREGVQLRDLGKVAAILRFPITG